jgi:hypothetical protein
MTEFNDTKFAALSAAIAPLALMGSIDFCWCWRWGALGMHDGHYALLAALTAVALAISSVGACAVACIKSPR